MRGPSRSPSPDVRSGRNTPPAADAGHHGPAVPEAAVRRTEGVPARRPRSPSAAEPARARQRVASPTPPWVEQLARTPAPTRWGELAATRAVLTGPQADAPTRQIGRQLGELQAMVMSPTATRAQFMAASHAVDEAIQSAHAMPNQAVIIAYADLQVQQGAAAGRWPPPAEKPPLPPWAADAA